MKIICNIHDSSPSATTGCGVEWSELRKAEGCARTRAAIVERCAEGRVRAARRRPEAASSRAQCARSASPLRCSASPARRSAPAPRSTRIWLTGHCGTCPRRPHVPRDKSTPYEKILIQQQKRSSVPFRQRVPERGIMKRGEKRKEALIRIDWREETANWAD